MSRSYKHAVETFVGGVIAKITTSAKIGFVYLVLSANLLRLFWYVHQVAPK